MYYVYILTNKSNTLYVGFTDDLARRIHQHKIRKNHFTYKYNINKLIFYQEFNQIMDAVNMEKRIKGWTRKKKIALVKTINPEFEDLLSLHSEPKAKNL